MLISLVGLPGVGKSTVGRKLARRLEAGFFDCDAQIEARIGRSISDFFEAEGEAAFRDQEESVLADLVAGERDAVIATGGGAVVRAGNRRLLREATYCIYLESRPEALFHRLRRSTHRPLMRVADPEARLLALAHERDPLYREAAGLVVDAGQSVAVTVAAIEAALRIDDRPVQRAGP